MGFNTKIQIFTRRYPLLKFVNTPNYTLYYIEIYRLNLSLLLHNLALLFFTLVEGDEFDAEEVSGSWGHQKKHFYGGNPNEKFQKKKGGKADKKSTSGNDEEDELVSFLLPKSINLKRTKFYVIPTYRF